VRLGVQPILWTNDDFHDLGGDVPLARCLAEMQAAGYEGTELGRLFPRRADVLQPLLERHGLRLASGWHSLHLLEQPFEAEAARLAAHLDLLATLGCRVAIVAECSGRSYTDPQAPLRLEPSRPGQDAAPWGRLARDLDRLAVLAAGRGLRLAYHHHAGTVVQTEAEIEALMQRTHELQLLFDTGHLALAGADPLHVLRRYAGRVAHVHLKDVRPAVVRRARDERLSFSAAVRAGVFTVPGDGGIDFEPLLAVLAAQAYRGWLVVEAEQDPHLAPPLHYARLGRAHLTRLLGRPGLEDR
jgi:inosose dehydratase